MISRRALKKAPLIASAVLIVLSVAAHAAPDKKDKQQGRLLYGIPGLTTVDYEVYAQHNDRKSDTKSVSQFDDRSQVYIDLKISTQ